MEEIPFNMNQSVNVNVLKYIRKKSDSFLLTNIHSNMANKNIT
jgi:hypothetical protein